MVNAMNIANLRVLLHRKRVRLAFLSLMTYAGAATAVLAHEERVTLASLFEPQSFGDLVAALGLAVAIISLTLNGYLRWQALRVARAAAEAQALALAEVARAQKEKRAERRRERERVRHCKSSLHEGEANY